MITDDVFASFLHCERKAFLRESGALGDASDFETAQLHLEQAYFPQALEKSLAAFSEQDVLHTPPYLDVAIKTGPKAIVNAVVAANGVSSQIHVLELISGPAHSDAAVYSPILFMPNERVSRADKLRLVFKALVLSSVQGVLPPLGKIVYGNCYKVLKCHIEPLVGEVRKLVAKIQQTQAKTTAPRVTLNRHCNICEFQAECQRLAEETDDLSLLRGMPEKEIQKQRNRGITTVTQFAYTYRPARRGKRKTETARKHDHALQAVALRDKKVFVLDSPKIPHSTVALYLDVESIPDRGFDYLIGLVAAVGDRTTTYSFWADNQTQTKAIWDACSHVINSFDDYTLYHYGKYEQRFFDRMSERADVEAAATIDRIRARSCNVLAAIYSHIYFPTHYNGLKDIAAFLGATWTAGNASGIQSMAWRFAWEASRNDIFKQQLLRYNLDDCLALQRVTEFILSLCAGVKHPVVATSPDRRQVSGFHFGKTQFFCPELDHINTCAYSDYQREKVYFRTSPDVRKSLNRQKRADKRRLRIDKEITGGKPDVCPECGGARVVVWAGEVNHKVLCDLKFTRSGVKRWIVKHTSGRFRCRDCRKTFFADGYRNLSPRWGNSLSSWVVHQHVALRQSYHDIRTTLSDLFAFSVSNTFLTRITLWAAERYKDTYNRMKDKLRQGVLINADETKVTVRNNTGYVWAFTNLEEVVFVYTPTREGSILEDMLQGFDGILVSDFYAAYDSAQCPQQKCLIHLIRDINNDVFRNPFDAELKRLAQMLVTVLKPIIDTIDRYGLKQCHLNKHKESVANYFASLSAQAFASEVAKQYQKRMQRYQDKLFVFLDHDGIPWNNNNAENAIKGFASRRRLLGASSTERGLQNYLVFLSIYQTCRRKNLSFLRFLLSGKRDVDAFANETS
jgi:predicted RecB family nuclease